MRVKCSTRFSLCKKIRNRTMVIPRAWIREKVVLYKWRRSGRRMGQNCWADDVKIRRKRTPSFPCYDSIVPRNAQKQRRWKIINTLLRWPGRTIETVFRTIISVNQLSIYGAVWDLCEEYKACHVRTGRPVLAGQSALLFVPSVMKTHTHTLADDPAQEEDLLQRYQERVER